MRTAEPVLQPFLALSAILRSGDDNLVGYFSASKDVWVVDGVDGVRPIVLMGSECGGTSTVTKARMEQDDTDVGAFCDTVTRTLVRTEQDDAARLSSSLLEVTTKTDAKTERDDVANGLEEFTPRSTLRDTHMAVPVH